MQQIGPATKKWCMFLVWTGGDFEQAKQARDGLRATGLVSWVHPPTQPECNWMVPVASDTLTEAGVVELLEANAAEFQLWWEGPYFNEKMEDDPYYPHHCAGCGEPTNYKYRSMEFEHPTDPNSSSVNIPDDNEMEPVLVKVVCYDKWTYICFACLEGFIGDNEMTTGGTGIWMSG